MLDIASYLSLAMDVIVRVAAIVGVVGFVLLIACSLWLIAEVLFIALDGIKYVVRIIKEEFTRGS